MKSYFFVSYAAREDRRWARRFHADLAYELGLLVGTTVGGIIDIRPRPGMNADLALAAGAGRRGTAATGSGSIRPGRGPTGSNNCCAGATTRSGRSGGRTAGHGKGKI